MRTNRICCPVHGGGDANVSLWRDERGRLRAKCWSYGCDPRGILAALGESVGPTGTPDHQPDDAKRIELARKLWRDAQPATGTTVERYLRATRGITVPPPPTLRFTTGRHVPSQSGPWAIMVAAVQDAAGRIVAIHRTYLTSDGRKAPVKPVKMALGPIGGGAVRLAKADEILAIAEGVETALSVLEATGIPTWAALGTSNLRRVELPASVREIVICGDADPNGAGERAAQAAARRFLREGRRVRIAMPALKDADFNDELRE